MEGCQLTLRSGPRNLGVVQRLPMRFDCVLERDAWHEMAGRTEPFCESTEGADHQWLNRNGEISLLLTPNGG